MPSSLARVLAEVFPQIASHPSTVPQECWVGRLLRRDPPQFADLSEAVDLIDQRGQLGPFKRRLREQHPRRRAHRDQYDARVIDCLTEACAFAWAAARGLAPVWDHRSGAPDIHVPPDTWIEAKAINPSPATQQVWDEAGRAGVVTASVGDVADVVRLSTAQAALDDALRKFARQGTGARGIVFFNEHDVGPTQMIRRRELQDTYRRWANQAAVVHPEVGIVLTHNFDWQAPFYQRVP